MEGRKRKFIKGAVNHVYQNTVHGVNIFYSLEDYVSYFTIFSRVSKKYEVNVLGICLMYDHVHALVSASDKETLGRCIGEITSWFVKEYNLGHGRTGSLFNVPFGSSVKAGDKQVRTAIAYLYNNPVEKKLCKRAEQYRWNFLAYACSSSPFSVSRKYREISVSLRKAKSEICCSFRSGYHVNRLMLRRLLKSLDSVEQEMLVDYIVSLYSCIDYESLIAFYGGYDLMLTAVNSNTGSEYDIRETFCRAPDLSYSDMISYLTKEYGLFEDAGQVISLPLNRKLELFQALRKATAATDYQIRKFLHLQTVI